MRRTLLEEVCESLFNDVVGSYPITPNQPKPIPFKKEFELPGVKKEEVTIEYDGANLLIKVDNKRNKRDLSYRLPSSVYNIEEIDAVMNDGLLEINIPLKESSIISYKKILIK